MKTAGFFSSSLFAQDSFGTATFVQAEVTTMYDHPDAANRRVISSTAARVFNAHRFFGDTLVASRTWVI